MSAPRFATGAAGIFLAALLCAGCAAPQQPRMPNANWSLLGADPSPQDTALQVGVVRADCAGGKTGQVTGADVQLGAQQVVVGVFVEELAEGAYSCPSNDTVPYTLELGEALGERELVDGACLDAQYESSPACGNGGLRYQPPVN